MALTILISSVFILNTKGPLNEQQFVNLKMMCNLRNLIEDQGCVVIKPSLLWLMRDFSTALEDNYGNPFSTDEYLERSLSSPPVIF